MSKERKPMPEISVLANHPLVRKIDNLAHAPRRWSRLVEEVANSRDLIDQRVTVFAGDVCDMAAERDREAYSREEEAQTAPKYVRLGYLEGSRFTFAYRGYFQGVSVQEGRLHYVIDWCDAEGEVRTEYVPVIEAQIAFLQDEFDRELRDVERVLGEGLDEHEKGTVNSAIRILESYAENEVIDYIGILCDQIDRLDAGSHSIITQAALERLIYIYCFSYSIDWEIGTKAFSKNTNDNRACIWEYEERPNDPEYIAGELRGVVFEAIEGRFIPYVYIGSGEEELTRIALRDIESANMLL